jgi:hypothetical protein
MDTLYSVIPATEELAIRVADNLRPADVEEVWASSHHDPREAMMMSVMASRDAKVGMVGTHPVCVFGVVPYSLLSDRGVPWMLCTAEIEGHARAFLKGNRKVIREWRQSYRLLRNFVDARNVKSIQWLRWLGFTVYAAQPYGVERLPFHQFDMVGDNV